MSFNLNRDVRIPLNRQPRFYLAGPFFNDPQIELMRDLEEACNRHRGACEYFSPRLHAPQFFGGKGDPEDTLEANIEGLDECDVVLAVVDYLLPASQSLRIVDNLDHHVRSDSIRIPDSGTVWEMGYATASDMPVVMVTRDEAPKGLNLMLAKTAVGIIPVEKMTPFIHGDIDVMPFEGDLR